MSDTRSHSRIVMGRAVAGLVGTAFLGLAGALPVGSVEAQQQWSGTPQEAFQKSPIVAKYQCTTCHTVAGGGGTVGPILNRVGNRRSEEWLRRWLADPQQVKPGTKMPKFPFNDREYESAVGYLTKLSTTVHSAPILADVSLSSVEKGARLFAAIDCYACHRLGDEGRFIGPDLTWLGLRKKSAWEKIWLHDPAAWKRTTFMPNFQLADAEIDALTAFLESLQGQDNEAGQIWEMRAAFFLGGDPETRGEQVYNRFACWACHGRPGAGGERNPNAAPNERMPVLDTITVSMDLAGLTEHLKQGSRPDKLDPAGAEPPFACPDYGNYMSESELANLFAYLESLVPEGSKWEFR